MQRLGADARNVAWNVVRPASQQRDHSRRIRDNDNIARPDAVFGSVDLSLDGGVCCRQHVERFGPSKRD